MARQRIGEWLVQRGVVSFKDVQQAVAAAEESGTRLASQLLSMKLASEEALVDALATIVGISGIDLSMSALNLEALALIPREVAEIEHILPLKAAGDSLLLAMADAQNARVLEEVRLISGKKIVPYLALSGRLETVISAAYEAASKGQHFWIGEGLPKDTAREVLALRMTSLRVAPNAPSDFQIDVDEGSVTSEEEEVGAVRARPAGRVILAVDDDEDVLKLLRDIFRRDRQIRLEVARRGQEALTRANDLLPDLILLDANIPEVHGFEVCRKLKSHPRFKDVPIVLMTGVYRGWRFAHDTRETFGADDYLEKPFRAEELLRRVAALLDKATGEPDQSKDQVEKLYNEGMQQLDAGQPVQAAASFEKATALDPFNFKTQYQLARALQASGDAFRAMHAYERTVELKPDHFPAMRSLATLYQQKGFRQKALEAWERAIPVAPDEPTRSRIRTTVISLLQANG